MITDTVGPELGKRVLECETVADVDDALRRLARRREWAERAAGMSLASTYNSRVNDYLDVRLLIGLAHA